MESETRVEEIITRIKNHPILSLIIVFGIIVIALGQFTDALQSIRDFLVSVNLIEQKEFSYSVDIKEPVAPPHAPEIPLKVIGYSSQKNASWPASAVTDGRRETAWISKPSSKQQESLILSTINETLFEISSVRICTASSNNQYASMGVRSVTLLISLEVEKPRTLTPCGTYSLPPERSCHYLHFSEPSTFRVLVVQVTENAGDPSVLISEISAYGNEQEVN